LKHDEPSQRLLGSDTPVRDSDIGVCLDTQGRVIAWNDRAAQALGYSWEDVREIRFESLFSEEHTSPEQDAFDVEQIMSGRDFNGGLHLKRKGEGETVVYLHATAGTDESGKVAGVVCVGSEVTRLWQTGRAARASEEKYRALFDVSPDVIVVMDPDGGIIEANHAAAGLTGYAPGELRGMSIRDLVPPERARDADAVFTRFWRRGQQEGTLELATKDGSRVLVAYSAATLKQEGRNCVMAVARDVSQQVRSETALRDSEAKYRRMFSSSRDGMFLETLDGHLLEVNQAACDMLGYTRDELLRKRLDELVPEETRTWLPQIAQALLRDRFFYGEAVNLRKDGSEVPVEISCSLVEPGDETLVLVSIRDISERRGAERRLRESEENFRALAENAQDGIAITNAAGEFVYANQRFGVISGYGTDELNGRDFLDLVAPAEKKKLRQRQDDRLRGAGAPREYETLLLRKDGTEVPVWTSISVTTWKGGQATIVAVRDMTEIKRAERELRFLADTATTLVTLTLDEDIWDFVARRLEEAFPGTVAAVNSFDPGSGVLMTRKLVGVTDAGRSGLREMLGVDVEGMSFPGVAPEVIESLASGQLVEVEGGVSAALLGMVPEPACRRIEEMLGIARVFSVGLRHEDRVLGNITVFTSEGQQLNTGLMETLAGQVSIALERRLAEVAVRVSEERYSSLVERAPLGIYRTAPDGRILMANPALAKMLGYGSVDELAAHNLEDPEFEPGYDRDEFKRRLESEGEITGLETSWRRADGTEVYIRENARLVRGDCGEPVCYEGTVEDLTERRASERAVRESEEKYRLVVERAMDGITILQDANIGYINEELASMIGYSPEELTGKPFLDYIHPDERKMVAERYAQRMAGKQVPDRYEAALLSKDGSRVEVELRATVIKQQGRPADLVFVRDITERKRKDEALRESEERHRTLQENLPVALFRTTPTGELVEVNPAAVRMFGYESAEEMKKVGVARLYADGTERDALVARAVAEGRLTNEEYTGLRADGTTFTGLLNVTAKRDSDGRVLCFDGVIQDVTEQRRIAAALGESEQRYRQVVERAADGVAIVQDGAVVYFNPGAARITGHEPDELAETLGQPFAKYIHPDSRQAVAERYRRRMAGEQVPDRYEAALVHRDGSRVDVEILAAVIEHRGRPADLTIIHDITERKRHEEQLRASEERYRKLIEEAPNGIAVHQDGVIKMVNPAVLRILGYDHAEEVVGRQVLDFVHPNDREAVVARIRTTLERGEPAQPDKERFVRKDGTPIWVEATGTPLTWKGQPAVRVVVRDVSELKRQEEALRNSEERYRSLFELLPDGVAVHQDGKVVMVNPAGARALGYDSPGEMVGKPVMDIVHPDDQPRVVERIKRALETGEPSPPAEERFRCKDGTWRRVSVINSPFTWAGRPAVQVHVHLLD